MDRGVTVQRYHIPFLAEGLVAEMLAKRNMLTTKLLCGEACDLQCDNNARVEVKCSIPQKTKPNASWVFSGLVGKKCDFFVCVGFDADFNPTYFIIPAQEIGKSNIIHISPNSLRSRFMKYKDCWRTIQDFNGSLPTTHTSPSA